MPESRKSSAEKKTGHGGRRPGAGRKPKGHCSPTAITELDLRAAQHAPVPDDIEDVAQQHAMAALAALVKIVALGAGDQARVNAANAILDRAYERPAVDAGGTAMLPFPGLARTRAAVVEQVRTEARRNARLAVDVLHRIAASVQITAQIVAKNFRNSTILAVGRAGGMGTNQDVGH